MSKITFIPPEGSLEEGECVISYFASPAVAFCYIEVFKLMAGELYNDNRLKIVQGTVSDSYGVTQGLDWIIGDESTRDMFQNEFNAVLSLIFHSTDMGKTMKFFEIVQKKHRLYLDKGEIPWYDN